MPSLKSSKSVSSKLKEASPIHVLGSGFSNQSFRSASDPHGFTEFSLALEGFLFLSFWLTFSQEVTTAIGLLSVFLMLPLCLGL